MISCLKCKKIGYISFIDKYSGDLADQVVVGPYICNLHVLVLVKGKSSNVIMRRHLNDLKFLHLQTISTVSQ